jgi:hypothetical protein
MYYPSASKVIPYGRVRLERLLPFPGEVLVEPGQRVEPMDVVGRAHIPSQIRILHVAQRLSVAEEDLQKYLLKGPGARVEKGEVIAVVGRWPLRRLYRAPAEGRIVNEVYGRLLLEISPSTYELRAYLKGVVTQVVAGRGLAIETSGAIMEGAWAIGGDAFGVLKILSEAPEGRLVPEAIDMGYHGAIVVVESWATKEGLGKAEEIGVRGVILGSLPSSLVGFVSSLSFPVMIMEGFGEIPISRPPFSLFQQHAGREACMASGVPHGLRLLRPQVIIPFLRGEEAPRREGPALKEGTLVRLVREPYLGKVGYVASLPPQKRRVEWGVEVEGIEVDLEEGGRVFVPLANLELLEGSSL